MKVASLIVFSFIWSDAVLASVAETEPGYANYHYQSSDTGEPFSILRTGTMVQPGIYEPGYLNYRYPSPNQGPQSAQAGKLLSSGVFEPIYLNYCVDLM